MEKNSINLFEKFKIELEKVITQNKLEEINIAYVSLNSNYWISWPIFKKFPVEPLLWKEYIFSQAQFDTWDLPRDFKVVFKDYSWIEYYQCFDPFYSEWIYRKPITRPLNKYYEKIPYTPKHNKQLVLGDFIKNQIILKK